MARQDQRVPPSGVESGPTSSRKPNPVCAVINKETDLAGIRKDTAYRQAIKKYALLLNCREGAEGTDFLGLLPMHT
jgi:hypothetical protein